ncbi:hypothetical protein CHS0354_041556, partial [Potamilus streckersoni]
MVTLITLQDPNSISCLHLHVATGGFFAPKQSRIAFADLERYFKEPQLETRVIKKTGTSKVIGGSILQLGTPKYR